MSYKILPLMNPSDSPIPLYSSIPKFSSHESSILHLNQRPGVYELMRGIEEDSNHYFIHRDPDSLFDNKKLNNSIGSIGSSHLDVTSSPSRLTDEIIDTTKVEGFRELKHRVLNYRLDSKRNKKQGKNGDFSSILPKSENSRGKKCSCEHCQKYSLMIEDPDYSELGKFSMAPSSGEIPDSLGTIENIEIESSLINNKDNFSRMKKPKEEMSNIVNSKTQRRISESGRYSSYEQQRIYDMMNLRMKLAKAHGDQVPFLRPMNFQDKYINAYSKGLPHDIDGFVNKKEMSKLIVALEARDTQTMSQVKLGGNLKLVNPSAAWSNDIIGNCSNIYKYSRLPSLGSDLIASEMSELYCMSLARDIPFNQYNNSAIIEDCCGYLNSLKTYPQVNGKVTPDNIFRGPMDSDLQGPYISQLLYRNLRIGGFLQKQKYPTDLEGYDFMKSWESAISAQNGIITESPPPVRSIPRYIITGRDLSSFIHNNDILTIFCNVCTIFIHLGVPMNLGIQKVVNDNPVESYSVNLGTVDIQSTICLISRNALLAAYYIKWNTLFPRPEALGIEIDRIFHDGKNTFFISPELLKNPVLEAVRSSNGNLLLSQGYPEGSPLNPSYPSEHGIIAGACATILKFFFDYRYEMDIYEPCAEGYELINTGKKTVVDNEINKLASNIGIGCSWSGINYHMDFIKGLKLGQRVAISCLQDLIKRYPHKLNISFPKFNNKLITIGN